MTLASSSWTIQETVKFSGATAYAVICIDLLRHEHGLAKPTFEADAALE